MYMKYLTKIGIGVPSAYLSPKIISFSSINSSYVCLFLGLASSFSTIAFIGLCPNTLTKINTTKVIINNVRIANAILCVIYLNIYA
ncbi:Uncharacterised protein [Chlamydia trachomatis]|nr:Uncharacterised protein [Chlamydia trachomatis]